MRKLLILGILFLNGAWCLGQTSKDASPLPVDGERVPPVFQDMGVVQRKAMNKDSRFLLSTYVSSDFSDGPYAMYGFNVNPGYALSDFWEVYVNYVPFFVNKERSIVKKVEALRLANGEQATIVMLKPKSQYGAEVLWSPLYGKDSLGISTIVRSDTFVKFGFSMLQYQSSQSGMKVHLGGGKTYFLGKSFGLRAVLSGNYIQTVLDGEKAFRFFGIIELGSVFYF